MSTTRREFEEIDGVASQICAIHGREREWCWCYECGGEGVSGHDCGEDCCCCLYPEDNMRCDICRGRGGWWRCYVCAPEDES